MRGRKPIQELTHKQRTVLRLMIRFVSQNGFQPTRKELSERDGTTPHAVTQKIWSLQDKGFLVASEGGGERSLTIRGIKFEPCIDRDGLTEEQCLELEAILQEISDD